MLKFVLKNRNSSTADLFYNDTFVMNSSIWSRYEMIREAMIFIDKNIIPLTIETIEDVRWNKELNRVESSFVEGEHDIDIVIQIEDERYIF